MATDDNKQLRWTFAIGLSVALHVLIVLLMAGTGGDDSPVKTVPPAISKDEPSSGETEPPPVNSGLGAQSGRTASVAPHVDAAPHVNAASPAEAKSYKTYVVKSGDNLSKIAKLDGSTLAELAELNETDVKTLSRLQIGQTIKVRNGVE